MNSNAKNKLKLIGTGLLVSVALIASINYLHRSKFKPEQQNQVAYDKKEALEAIEAIRIFYDIDVAIGKENYLWDKCHDTTIGGNNIESCANNVAKNIIALSKISSETFEPKYSCGQEILTTHKKYVLNRFQRYEKLLDWIQTYRKDIVNNTKTKSILTACSDLEYNTKWCQNYPIDSEIVSILELSNCTKRLFQCGKLESNVCWINKVASRIDAGDLYLRSTGERL